MILNTIFETVIRGDMVAVANQVEAALKDGLDPARILNESLIAAMAEVGDRFERDDCFVPEMLIAARAMKTGVALLKPHLIEGGIQPLAKVVMGTVKGDLHDIGKNLVAMMLEGSGFEIIDMGTDVAPEKFVDAIKTHRPTLVGLSALLTTTMPSMQATIDAIGEAGLINTVTVMVGGAPVNQKYADQIGADLFAADAASAARKAKEVLAA